MIRSTQQGLLILLLMLPFVLQAQKFSRFSQIDGEPVPALLQVEEVIETPGSEGYLLAGHYKAALPSLTAKAFIMELDRWGRSTWTKSLYTTLPNANNGVKVSSLALDRQGNIYAGGASVQDIFSPGGGSERTITMLNGQGNQVWSRFQANHSFDALYWDESALSLIAASGQIGSSKVATDIMISAVNAKGTYQRGMTLLTNTKDQAVKILPQAAGGYIVIANADLLGKPQPMVLKVAANLSVQWAYAYQGIDSVWVEDAAQVGGRIGLTGYTRSASNLQKQPIYISLDGQGNLQSFQKIDVQQQNALGLGVALYDYEGIQGAMIAGQYQPSGSDRMRGFVAHLNPLGDIRWIRGYTEYQPSDMAYTSRLKTIVVQPELETFFAAGELTWSEYGQRTVSKEIHLVRAAITDGLIYEGPACDAGLTALVTQDILQANPVGTGSFGGAWASFGYQQDDLSWSSYTCAVGLPNPIPPLPSSQRARYEKRLLPTQIHTRRVGSSLVLSLETKTDAEFETISVYGLNGQLLGRAKVVAGQEISVRMPGLAKGLYWLDLRQKNGPGIRKKFAW
ncbi:MAG: hypothetical protein AAFP92_18805 [Bacteroidota bacterium]